jgi:hypothetical protein
MSDLISRYSAIKAIDDLPNTYNGYSDSYDKAYIIGVLEELPSAERKENWISYVEEVPWGDGTTEVTRFECPRCSEVQDAETKFCSNCGQDLRLDRDRWISCSEYLPSDFEDVLVWYEYFRYGDYNRMYQTYGIGNYDSLYDIWGGDVNGHKARVIAWMPLPEPYREVKR